MVFAGLWDHWKNPEGQIIEFCTILTTATNELIKSLHDRMPVILDIRDVDLWLDPHITDPDQFKSLYKPYPSEEMEMFPVSAVVNSPKNDTPECIIPLKNN